MSWGRPWGQVLAAVAVSNRTLASAHLLSMTRFGLAAWAGLFAVSLHALRTRDDRWWLLAGLGLLDTDLTGFLAAASVGGCARRAGRVEHLGGYQRDRSSGAVGDLRRRSDTSDRWRVLVEATEPGHQCRREAFVGLIAGTNWLLSRYSPEELRLMGSSWQRPAP